MSVTLTGRIAVDVNITSTLKDGTEVTRSVFNPFDETKITSTFTKEYARRITLTGSTNYDLYDGSLLDRFGNAQTFTTCSFVFLRNLSTNTPTAVLTYGGGSLPIVTQNTLSQGELVLLKHNIAISQTIRFLTVSASEALSFEILLLGS